MRITPIGAAGEVTGSCYLCESDSARWIVDFGLFQGSKLASERNAAPLAFRPRDLDAVVLTHGHLDHSGRLPLLARHDYEGPVHATPATVELVELLLRDSAQIQESDAERENRWRERDHRPPVQPLYTVDDVERLLPAFEGQPRGRWFDVGPGVRGRFHCAGHILGAASAEFEVETGAGPRTLVFSGDLGPLDRPILHDFAPPERADLVFVESTYGGREHRPLEQTLEEFEGVLRDAAERKRRVLIPSFAVGRTQELLYYLADAFGAGRVPKMPVVLDSPLGTRATELYWRHDEAHDEEMRELRRHGELRRNLSTLEITASPEDSKALNFRQGPLLILAGSGMCNGGRILHHLRHGLHREDVDVLFVGYQAHGTLGRRLIDRPKYVRIFGDDVQVKARIHTLGGFSAHAGQADLLRWLEPMASRTGCRVVVTHGEPEARQAMAAAVAKRFKLEPELPGPLEPVEL